MSELLEFMVLLCSKSLIPQYCPQLVPVRVAAVCLSHSSAAAENVCAHLHKHTHCQISQRHKNNRSVASFFSFFISFSFTFRPLLKVFVLVLGPHGVLRLIV